MGKLRDRMTEDLVLRNYSKSTIINYLACCVNFVKHHRQGNSI